jgi:gluconolactonase
LVFRTTTRQKERVDILALVARKIATGVGRTEGPVIRADGEVIYVSMDQGKLYSTKGDKTSVFSDVGHQPNGATEALDGTIYVAQAGGQHFGPNAGKGGIQAVARDGKWRWVTQDPVAPNDLCFGPDGFLYFTDPTRNRPTRDDGRLWRCDVKTGEAELLCSLSWSPNGIGFGLEDDALYVARAIEKPGALQSAIARFPLNNGKLGKEELYIQFAPTHRPDGFLFDIEGNLVSGCNSNNKENDDPGQIQTYDRNGKLADTFVPGKGKSYTNVALAADKVLYITATSEDCVMAVDGWPKAGLPLHPFRKKG